MELKGDLYSGTEMPVVSVNCSVDVVVFGFSSVYCHRILDSGCLGFLERYLREV
jgi:hypothetical protein